MAKVLNTSRSTIERVVKRFRETGRNTRRAGSGTQRKTTAIDDRFLVPKILRNRRLISIQAKNQLKEVRGKNISSWTVCRKLQDVALKACRPTTGSRLLPRHRLAGLQFPREHVNSNLTQ